MLGASVAWDCGHFDRTGRYMGGTTQPDCTTLVKIGQPKVPMSENSLKAHWSSACWLSERRTVWEGWVCTKGGHAEYKVR